MILGIIIAGRINKPFRWIAPIKDFEITEDGKAFTTYKDNSNHFDDIHDVVMFNPSDANEILGGDAYYKIPEDQLEYVI